MTDYKKWARESLDEGAKDGERFAGDVQPSDATLREGVTDAKHAPALEFVAEPLKSRILKDAEEMGRVVEVILAADCIMIGWEGGSLETYR